MKLTDEEWEAEVNGLWEIIHNQHYIASKAHCIRTILDAVGPVVVFAVHELNDGKQYCEHDMTEQIGFDEFDISDAIVEFKKSFKEARDKK